ncbi:MAG: arylesterase [Lysobacterales bacterium]|nr:MAG: arylesterase [Xanthomonadales bacterium]
MKFLFAVWIGLATPVAGAGERTILVLGDSLSAAYGISLEQGWVALLAERLAPRGWGVVNASISGETSAGGVHRLPDLLDRYRPAIVILQLGGNDGLRGLSPAALESNLERMIASAREAGAKVLLLGIELPPNLGEPYRERIRAVYRELAQRYGLPFHPFFLEEIALKPGMMQPDGIHPTAAAQPAMLEAVWPLLEPLLGD